MPSVLVSPGSDTVDAVEDGGDHCRMSRATGDLNINITVRDILFASFVELV